MNTTPIPFQSVAADLLAAARAQTTYPYLPVVVDPGETADPGAWLAVLALLIRVGASRTGAGVELVLDSAADAIDEAIEQKFGNGTMTEREAELATETIGLARPWRHGDRDDAVTLQQLYDRATAWTGSHDRVDALGVTSVGVQLLQFLESIQPGILAALADDIEHLEET